MYSVVSSSDKAKAMIDAEVKPHVIPRNDEGRGRKASVYPFRLMNVGQSFGVPYNESNGKSLYNATAKAASDASKRLAPAKFVVIDHKELKTIECARIA